MGPRTLKALALALGVRVTALLDELADVPRESDVPRFLLQQIMPEVQDHKLAEILRAGAVADMQQHYADAELRYERALEVQDDDDLDTKAQLLIKCASAADNAGHSRRAIELLEPLLADRAWCKVKPWILDWMRYHVALAYRRTADRILKATPGASVEEQLGHAERLLLRVQTTGRPSQAVAATHQLGCLHWLRATTAPGNQAKRHLAKARRCFEEATRKWRKVGNFREGYALRRLADIAQRVGDGAGAHRLLLDALELFVAHDCGRYRNEVRAHLEELFKSRI